MKITEVLNEGNNDIPSTFTLPLSYSYRDLTKLPSDVYKKQWNLIIIDGNESLTSLKGAEQIKCKSFKINDCAKLETLKGIPSKIPTMFVCNVCPKIKSLKYCPQHVDIFNCDMTGISTLEGSPEKVKTYSCGGILWDEVGYTQTNTVLKTLKGCPKETDSFYCECAPHVDLKNIWTHIHYSEEMHMSNTLNRNSPLLGFLRIKGLTQVNVSQTETDSHVFGVLSILNKYLPLRSMSDIMKCKQELVKAGFKSNAKF